MRSFYIFFFCLTASFSCLSQSKNKQLSLQLNQADSIQIISHVALSKYIEHMSGEIVYGQYELLLKGKPNSDLIKEQITLDTKARNELTRFLSNSKKITGGIDIKCFEPRHAILIFKNSTCHFIDICFECKTFSVSKNLTVVPDFLMSENDWEWLEIFFRTQGIQYLLPQE